MHHTGVAAGKAMGRGCPGRVHRTEAAGKGRAKRTSIAVEVVGRSAAAGGIAAAAGRRTGAVRTVAEEGQTKDECQFYREKKKKRRKERIESHT